MEKYFCLTHSMLVVVRETRTTVGEVITSKSDEEVPSSYEIERKFHPRME